jgi:hypothetical protein
MAARNLRKYTSGERFLRGQLEETFANAHNPSSLGFVVEQMLLSAIAAAPPASERAFSVAQGVARVSARAGAPGFAASPSALTDPTAPGTAAILVTDAASPEGIYIRERVDVRSSA